MALSDIKDTYNKHIGSKPIVEIPAFAGAAGLGAYLASKPAMEYLWGLAQDMSYKQNDPKYAMLAHKWLAPYGDPELGRRRIAAMAALAGAMLGAYKHKDALSGPV